MNRRDFLLQSVVLASLGGATICGKAEESPDETGINHFRDRRKRDFKEATAEQVTHSVEKGIEALLAMQHSDGGWDAWSSVALWNNERTELGRGGELVRGRMPDGSPSLGTDVATTSLAVLVLLRYGNRTESENDRVPQALRKAVAFLISATKVDHPRHPSWITSRLAVTGSHNCFGLAMATVAAGYALQRVKLFKDAERVASLELLAPAIAKCHRLISRLQQTSGEWSCVSWDQVVLGATMGMPDTILGCLALEASLIEKLSQPDQKAKEGDWNRLDAGRASQLRPKLGADLVPGIFDLANLSTAVRAMAPLAAAAEMTLSRAKSDGTLPDDSSVSPTNLKMAGIPQGRANYLVESWSAFHTLLSKITSELLLRDGFRFISTMAVQGNHLTVPFLCDALICCPNDQTDRLLKFIHSGYVALQRDDGTWVDTTTVPWLEGGKEGGFDGRGKNILHPALSTTIGLLCLTAPLDLPWLKSVVQIETKRK
jgi:hypothetical protein